MFIFENKMIITKYHSIISLHDNILFLSVYNYKHDLIMYFFSCLSCLSYHRRLLSSCPHLASNFH